MRLSEKLVAYEFRRNVCDHTEREAPRTDLFGAVRRRAVYVFSGAMRVYALEYSVYALANTAARPNSGISG